MADMHETPRFTGRSGHAFSRSAFLSGKHKTLYGPGQAPDCFRGSSVNYKNPADWRPAGSLLRRPIVVWFVTHFYEAWKGEEITRSRLYYVVPPSEFSSGVVDTEWIVYSNMDYNETARIQSVAASVKAILESRYPGLVFVDHFDWMDGFGSDEPEVDYVSYNAIAKNYRWPFITHSAPHASLFGGLGGISGSQWIPTRFLSIFAGTAQNAVFSTMIPYSNEPYGADFLDIITVEEVKAKSSIINAINARGGNDAKLGGTTWLYHSYQDAAPTWPNVPDGSPFSGFWQATAAYFQGVSEMESAQQRGLHHKGSAELIQVESIVAEIEAHFGL